MRQLRIDTLLTILQALNPKFRTDSNEGIFFNRQLEEIESKLYEFKETELYYRQLIPVNSRVNPGAKTYTYRMYGKVGMAKIIASSAKDLPRCDIYAEEFTSKIRQLGTAFGYNTEDIRAALFTNTPLETNKATACRRVMNELMSSIAFEGDSGYGLGGFINNANIPTAVASTKDAGGTTWVVATADEIIADIRAGVSGVWVQSKKIHKPDTLILPQSQYDIIAMTPRSSQSDLTILEFVTKPGNSFGLKNVVSLPTELSGKFSGSTDGMIFYENSSDNFEQIIPLEMQMLPAQPTGLEFEIPVEAKHGGTVVRYPLAFYTIYGI